MTLAMHEKYKGQVIYVDIKTGWFIVYKDQGDPIAREAIRLFVQSGIDINMPIYALHTSERVVKNDIDIDEIISRGEQKFGLQSWI